VDAADLPEFVEFEEGQVVRKRVFESPHLFVQTVCLDRNGSWGPVTDPDSDAMATIVAGEAVFLVDRARKRLKQWGAVLVPAGAELVIRNASPEPLVVLMVVSPPPSPRAVTG
jgi:quercetin dioxygenase-like cupin family protein